MAHRALGAVLLRLPAMLRHPFGWVRGRHALRMTATATLGAKGQLPMLLLPRARTIVAFRAGELGIDMPRVAE